jgi:hypothetical protein
MPKAAGSPLEYYYIKSVIKEGRSACQSDVIKTSDVRRSRADPDPDLHSHSGTTKILITSHLPLAPL